MSTSEVVIPILVLKYSFKSKIHASPMAPRNPKFEIILWHKKIGVIHNFKWIQQKEHFGNNIPSTKSNKIENVKISSFWPSNEVKDF